MFSCAKGDSAVELVATCLFGLEKFVAEDIDALGCRLSLIHIFLSRLPQDSVYRPMADTILAQLAGVEQIDIGLVPENSLLWEFLKK